MRIIPMNKYMVIFRSGSIFHIIADQQQDALDLVPLQLLWREAPTIVKHWAYPADYLNPNTIISYKGRSHVPNSPREFRRV
jgi:hypothetical protein